MNWPSRIGSDRIGFSFSNANTFLFASLLYGITSVTSARLGYFTTAMLQQQPRRAVEPSPPYQTAVHAACPSDETQSRGSVFSLAFSASEPSSRNPDCYTALHGNICFHVSSAPALLCANRVGACSQTVKWKYRRLLDASSGNRIPPSSSPFIPNVALVFALSVTTGKHAALLSTTRR